MNLRLFFFFSCFSLSCFSLPSSAMPFSPHTIYIGAAAGIGSGHAKTASEFDDSGGLRTSYTANSKLSSQFFSGGFLAGYDRVWGCFLAGLSFQMLFSNLQASENITNPDLGGTDGNHSLRIKGGTHYGPSLRLGYINQNTLWFISFGLMWQKFSLRLTVQGPNNRAPELKKSSTQMAFVPGLGVETKLNENHSIGVMYQAEIYQKFKGRAPSSRADTADTASSVRQITHSIHLVYKISLNFEN